MAKWDGGGAGYYSVLFLSNVYASHEEKNILISVSYGHRALAGEKWRERGPQLLQVATGTIPNPFKASLKLTLTAQAGCLLAGGAH